MNGPPDADSIDINQYTLEYVKTHSICDPIEGARRSAEPNKAECDEDTYTLASEYSQIFV